VRPFLKWPGGKRWAAPLIGEIVRKHLRGTYYEPFVGGGALFFHLCPPVAVLSDVNAELINTYRQVRDRPKELLRRLKSVPVSSAEYYAQRLSKPTGCVQRAVRFLYLNRTAFGGIYRLNSAGEFNVPYGGGGRTPAALWRRNLLVDASGALAGSQLVHTDFETQLDSATSGDVCYCDPTYTVAHNNNGFIRYNERNFAWSDQERLAEAAHRAACRGAAVIVSNAQHSSINKLYKGRKRITLTRHSRVSASSSHRGLVEETLIVIRPSR
jgi:DNA adenine methylase